MFEYSNYIKIVHILTKFITLNYFAFQMTPQATQPSLLDQPFLVMNKVPPSLNKIQAPVSATQSKLNYMSFPFLKMIMFSLKE